MGLPVSGCCQSITHPGGRNCLQGHGLYYFVAGLLHFDPVPQRAAIARPLDRHIIAILQRDPFAEAERAGTEEMYVRVAGASVRLVFEMMMLDIRKGMAHALVACGNFLGPEDLAVALDGHGPGDERKVGVEDQLRADRAGAEFRMGQV